MSLSSFHFFLVSCLLVSISTFAGLQRPENLVLDLTGGGDWQSTSQEFVEDAHLVQRFSEQLMPIFVRNYRGVVINPELASFSKNISVPYMVPKLVSHEELNVDYRKMFGQLATIDQQVLEDGQNFCRATHRREIIKAFEHRLGGRIRKVPVRYVEFPWLTIDGPSSKDSLHNGLLEIKKRARKNDHVWISINDHGSEDGQLILSTIDRKSPNGMDYETVKAAELRRQIAELTSGGVNVHLTVEACYSGKFVEAMASNSSEFPVHSSRGSVCVVASSDSRSVGFGGFYESYLQTRSDAAGDHWSQMIGYENSLSNDLRNIPYSSLDLILQDWQIFRMHLQLPRGIKDSSRSMGLDFPTELHLSPTNGDLPTSETALDHRLRAELKEAVFEVLRFKDNDCEIHDDQAQKSVSNQSADVQFLVAYSACFQKISDDQKKDCTGGRSSQRDSCYWQDVANKYMAKKKLNPMAVKCKHLDFINKAPILFLKRYRSSFCCLAYEGTDTLSHRFENLCR